MYVWGGKAWNRFVNLALESMQLHGRSILEIGFHDGELSREFAKRGAKVTAVEIRRDSWEKVKQAENVTFLHYDGDLDSISGTFDYVFTKSVLVTTDLSKMLPAIVRKLKPNGQVVFIENGMGSLLMQFLRRIKHPTWSFGHLHYFTSSHIDQIRESLDVEVRYNRFPPVYLISGKRRHG